MVSNPWILEHIPLDALPKFLTFVEMYSITCEKKVLSLLSCDQLTSSIVWRAEEMQTKMDFTSSILNELCEKDC